MDGAISGDESMKMEREVVTDDKDNRGGARTFICGDRVFGQWGWGYCLWRLAKHMGMGNGWCYPLYRRGMEGIFLDGK